MTNTAIVIHSSLSSIPPLANPSSVLSLVERNLGTQIIRRTRPEQIGTNFDLMLEWIGSANFSMVTVSTDLSAVTVSADLSAITISLPCDTGTSPIVSTTTNHEKYSALFAALEELASLDEEDNHFIDGSTARAARRFLSLLSLYSVAAPQIFPHGGDTVVFKWTVADETTAYVTVGDGSVSLRTYRLGEPLSPPVSFDEQELTVLMLQLGGKQWRAVKAA